ncbi:hypothetical protein AGDE_13949 [Angomonas deanei]|nr:hypothetical protein AGDE_13949 [Angomonas deanei]|eukprot:EPY21606.1 hypothetical protein AGDE_13949 [Angomonas deanei]
MSVNPVPTIGITLLLFAHRTFHVKYFQTLTLLGIEDQDIHWESSDSAIKATESAWRSLFDEAYVGALEKGETFVCEDGPYNPILPNAAFKATSPEKMHTFVKDATPSKGILSGPKDGKKPKRSVTLCCGDTEHGVF